MQRASYITELRTATRVLSSKLAASVGQQLRFVKRNRREILRNRRRNLPGARKHQVSPHVKERWSGDLFFQSFRWLFHRSFWGELSSPQPFHLWVGAISPRYLGFAAPRSPAAGGRNIVSRTLESKRKVTSCALLCHRNEIIEDFRLQIARDDRA